MSRKRRKIRKKIVSLSSTTKGGPTLAGFPLNKKKINQLWDWRTLEDVKF